MIGRLQTLVKNNTTDRAAPGGGNDNATNESGLRWKHLSGLKKLDEEGKVKAYKLTIDLDDGDAFGELSDKQKTEILWDNFVEEQSVVTIEDIKLNGKTVYVYPSWDDKYNESTLKRLQSALDDVVMEYNVDNNPNP